MAWVRIDRTTFLESRVGRRLFAVFAACAMVPVVAFAAFSYGAVQDQLDRDALGTLQRATKAAGMAILERLLLADLSLQLATRGGRAEGVEAGRALRRVVPLAPSDARLARLDERARRHLGQGQAVLQADATAGGPSLALIRYREAARPASGAWLGELDPGFVFGGERQPAGGRLWVVGPEGRLLHSSDPDRPDDLPATASPAPDREDGESLVASRELFLASTFAAPSWSVHVSRPVADVRRPLREFEALFPWIVALTIGSALGLTLIQIRRTLVPIGALEQGARRVAAGQFGLRVEVSTGDEFASLAESFNDMAAVIDHQLRVLSLVNQVGAMLSAERDTGALVELILTGTMEATGARVGAFFQMSEEGRLELSRARGPGAERLGGEILPRRAVERSLRARGVARVVSIAALAGPDREEWAVLAAHLREPPTSFLAVPMRDERREDLGVLLLVSDGDREFSGEQCALAESLASQAAVAIRKNQLVESFKGLFEGLIQLTVGAIDEKSAHTGQHCRNVPIITELIADAVCADRVGSFKDVHFTEEERYELRIAALLHDCGKVVTPVHVMDKATKLETIYDRVDLIATRFELLRRDAAIRSLSRRLARAGLPADAGQDAVLREELRALDEDLAFVRACNAGVEGMREADRERVRAVARRHLWQDAAGRERPALEPDEVANLLVRRGTLNREERRIIEHHVVATMNLLQQLPFPRDLRNVPAIAGAHHERLDGSGYPLRLRGEQLSLQARILGLADVFEALTAPDRPYKEGRTLRETLDILEQMRRQRHVDAELLALFLRERIHLRYAAEHLDPAQIDAEFHAELERMTGP